MSCGLSFFVNPSSGVIRSEQHADQDVFHNLTSVHVLGITVFGLIAVACLMPSVYVRGIRPRRDRWLAEQLRVELSAYVSEGSITKEVAEQIATGKGSLKYKQWIAAQHAEGALDAADLRVLLKTAIAGEASEGAG